MSWFAYAMAASLFWGISYTVSEQLMKKISIASVMLWGGLGSLVFGLCLGLATNVFQRDIAALKRGEGALTLLLASTAVYVTASVFILLATKAKNATMAAMLEISYPLFTALFAWLIFKETQFNTGTIAGTMLVLSGVALIYYFGKNL